MITFDVANSRSELHRLREEAAAPSFWDDQGGARKTMARLSRLDDEVGRYDRVMAHLAALEDMNRLGLEEDDPAFEEEIASGVRALEEEMRDIEDAALLQGEFDRNNAIVSLHPGAGGMESQEWAEMLMRMYLRWAERRGFQTDLNDVQPGEGAGIKSATFTVRGPYAYGLLSLEKGVHRLVRISPFDFSRRRHTSFVSLDAIPEAGEDVDIEIDPKDLRIDTFRSSGAGGQHVNVTDSAVRITHLATGIVVQCQNERSQMSNKTIAMKILKSRLLERARREKEKELEEMRGQKMEIGWGSQIRSYVFHPYQMVKDHRTGVETGNISAVMDGEIDQFLEEGLRWRKKQEVASGEEAR
ncbi:MAG: peptide chain release factor 2 [Actinobacteria bacterium]|nr:peptide chain release factor 2 [Actinomycetota bacterium]MBU1945228.1 peptide chain release factor 2 [Actinomycetota bacterium]MBU2687800.1 peptide chain release factor 2 [Actinomycetota bacterium]